MRVEIRVEQGQKETASILGEIWEKNLNDWEEFFPGH